MLLSKSADRMTDVLCRLNVRKRKFQETFFHLSPRGSQQQQQTNKNLQRNLVVLYSCCRKVRINVKRRFPPRGYFCFPVRVPDSVIELDFGVLPVVVFFFSFLNKTERFVEKDPIRVSTQWERRACYETCISNDRRRCRRSSATIL